MILQVQLPLVMPTVPVQIPAAPLLNQPPANALGSTNEVVSSAWIPVSMCESWLEFQAPGFSLVNCLFLSQATFPTFTFVLFHFYLKGRQDRERRRNLSSTVTLPNAHDDWGWPKLKPGNKVHPNLLHSRQEFKWTITWVSDYPFLSHLNILQNYVYWYLVEASK